jgi:hypothetical protein
MFSIDASIDQNLTPPLANLAMAAIAMTVTVLHPMTLAALGAELGTEFFRWVSAVGGKAMSPSRGCDCG